LLFVVTSPLVVTVDEADVLEGAVGGKPRSFRSTESSMSSSKSAIAAGREREEGGGEEKAKMQKVGQFAIHAVAAVDLS
jgi:hypothetical protein